MKTPPLFLTFLVFAAFSMPAAAQSKIAFVDSEYIYGLYPEFATTQQQLDRLAAQWTEELEALQQDVDRLFQEYQARELLYTRDERKRKEEEIMQAEEDLGSRRLQYFGPEGELYRQQDAMLRPIQEKILIAVESVAIAEGYDYVFDRSGDYVFLFAEERFNISDLVLEELGIEVQQSTMPGGVAGSSSGGGGRQGQNQ